MRLTGKTDTTRTRCCRAILRMAGLLPTRQRVIIASFLFSGEHHHTSADELFAAVTRSGERLSLATIYNTLHQFCDAGLLREVATGTRRLFFDTNTSNHHHFYIADEERLEDIPIDGTLTWLPQPPSGTIITHVDLLVRVRRKPISPHAQ